MKTSDFDYNLPAKSIAQMPASPRDHSKLLVFDRDTKEINHDIFFHLDKYLEKGDVLVFNQSKVFPARIKMFKKTGGQVEVFLLKNLDKKKWQCMVGGRRVEGQILELKMNSSEKLLAKIEKNKTGEFEATFNFSGSQFFDILEKFGQTPLPPYIKTEDSQKVRGKYQTVYARERGSVAAPTAGLHFTDRVMKKLRQKGVRLEFITLHVGAGTFLPVKTEKLSKHKMHAEFVDIDQKTAERLNKYKQENRKIIAVGTTTLRALEAVSDQKGQLKKHSGEVNIFITPGYSFQFVDSLVTNFHLPKSTLLMLVSAMLREKNSHDQISRIRKIYQNAIKEDYRFYSFGDAMFLD
jgi:S-adenosylmethionine:tRNA ribosyltransferase-isomerase